MGSDEEPGIIPLAVDELFAFIHEVSSWRAGRCSACDLSLPHFSNTITDRSHCDCRSWKYTMSNCAICYPRPLRLSNSALVVLALVHVL